MKLLLQPSRPFVAVAKYDTKIGPLVGIYNKVDKLILGGVMYNTYLCAKYGVKIKGIQVSLNYVIFCDKKIELVTAFFFKDGSKSVSCFIVIIAVDEFC